MPPSANTVPQRHHNIAPLEQCQNGVRKRLESQIRALTAGEGLFQNVEPLPVQGHTHGDKKFKVMGKDKHNELVGLG